MINGKAGRFAKHDQICGLATLPISNNDENNIYKQKI